MITIPGWLELNITGRSLRLISKKSIFITVMTFEGSNFSVRSFSSEYSCGFFSDAIMEKGFNLMMFFCDSFFMCCHLAELKHGQFIKAKSLNKPGGVCVDIIEASMAKVPDPDMGSRRGSSPL